MNQTKIFSHDEKLDCLLEVWMQFSIPNKSKNGRWAGGLSALEEVEMILFTDGYIDAKGNPTPPNSQ